ncbi:hypothetical protein [uncultured Tenacibaculum sp.]|uniref:hypothetical protein n=1 Tax=uncultured Tenacibaculum sp. TaxID=174713 RepID=UPI002613332D|nr:hypothetical protein [uncultured Tenacibaculum sp.]
MKKRKWKKYIFEFLSIFIAVLSAFMLSNWNENKNSSLTEQKILTEIKNGIALDLKDFEANYIHHKFSLNINKQLRNVLTNKKQAKDSINRYYLNLFSEYPPVINYSGYESFKESGLKIIKNDALRFQIITLYDYYYGIIEKIHTVDETSFFKNYYQPINKLLHPFMEFDAAGKINKIKNINSLSTTQKKEILSYLAIIDRTRKFKIMRYEQIIKEMKMVEKNIEKELKQ